MPKFTITNLFAKVKVQKQLWIIFFIAILIPAILIGNYLIFNSRSLLLEHYQSQCRSDNLRIKSILLDLTSSIYYKAEDLSSDEELSSLLMTQYSSPDEALQTLNQYKNFETLLSQDAAIQKIAVYTWNSTIPDSKYIHPITSNIRQENWLQKSISTAAPFWMERQHTDRWGNTEVSLCLYSRIFLPKIRSYAILSITVSSNHIKNRIENSSLHTVLWLNKESFFYSSTKSDQDASLTAACTPGPTAFYLGRIQIKQRPAIGCISALSTAYSEDLFYIASLDYDGYPYIRKITCIYIGILFFILLLVSLLIFYYSRYFSHRIITLRESMHKASQGNYQIIDEFQGEDEISDAFSDLNIMIQNILHKEASVYQAQIRAQELINQRQQMEFKMLSSQINPHFLYNTLETIRMRSLKAGNREVANAVKLLGKSMRYVLGNTTTDYTSLTKELDYIQTYLAIQKLRFHDRVNYSLHIPDTMDTDDYQIMPLLLQPIVENCILHGLEEVEEDGWIIIHIEEQNQNLYIKIFDNGCGMTKEELESMKETMYHHQKDSSRSIGLSNIFQRIQLCYGQEYGLQVRSKKQAGTLFIMIIPAQKYRRET